MKYRKKINYTITALMMALFLAGTEKFVSVGSVSVLGYKCLVGEKPKQEEDSLFEKAFLTKKTGEVKQNLLAGISLEEDFWRYQSVTGIIRNEETGQRSKSTNWQFVIGEIQDAQEQNFRLDKEADEASNTDANEEETANTDIAVETAAPPIVNPYGSITLSTEDRTALERIVQAEAGGEDEVGKILVAQVVLNRVNDPHFANSARGVIFEKIGGSTQFSPIADGRYETVTVTEDTKRAVELALNGEDISEGAVCFMARRQSSAKNVQWFDNHLKRLFGHGGHEFFTLP
ncbi:hypothetical protein FACS1894111_00960 [Clostridia bacterium]|nr:hypothetical protein FACS1894111_00960 [Clostridia bacterium]